MTTYILTDEYLTELRALIAEMESEIAGSGDRDGPTRRFHIARHALWDKYFPGAPDEQRD